MALDMFRLFLRRKIELITRILRPMNQTEPLAAKTPKLVAHEFSSSVGHTQQQGGRGRARRGNRKWTSHSRLSKTP